MNQVFAVGRIYNIHDNNSEIDFELRTSDSKFIFCKTTLMKIKDYLENDTLIGIKGFIDNEITDMDEMLMFVNVQRVSFLSSNRDLLDNENDKK